MREARLNYVDLREGTREVGGVGLNQIRRLCAHIGIPWTRKSWNARLAPSIISRSEAMLFGLSLPRFAIRLYLDKEKQNFLNLRRLGTFCDRARSWGRRLTPMGDPDLREYTLKDPPAWVLREAKCIADSVLTCPLRLRQKQFHVVSSELGLSYGENHKIFGTPYLQHVRLAGGGLCAQAACFMATALLHQHARGVFGVAEVTALGTRTAGSEIRLSGMGLAEIEAYFTCESVGLSAYWQQAVTQDVRDPTIAFRHILQSYSLSDMPIILPVDAGRVAGNAPRSCPLTCPETIYRTNKLRAPDLLRDPYEINRRSHTVVIVGCNQSDDFVFHDPGIQPFLIASSSQLAEVGPYTTPRLDSIMQGVCLPITPSRVKVPLGQWLPPGTVRLGSDELTKNDGLLRLAYFLQRFERPGLPCFPARYELGSFRLMHFQGEKIKIPPAISRTSIHEDNWRRVAVALIADGWCDRWLWVQACPRPCSIWVWDAEQGTRARSGGFYAASFAGGSAFWGRR